MEMTGYAVWHYDARRMRHHLVILHAQYLARILDGRKRIECRLSAVRRAPFQTVKPGDLLWIKLPSKGVAAVAVAGRCQFREVRSQAGLARALRGHRAAIAADPGFLRDRSRGARFLTLIWIRSIVEISSFAVQKRDQRAWVTLTRPPRPGARIDSVPADRIKVRTELPVRKRRRPRRRQPG